MKNYFIIAIITMSAMAANKSFAQINRFFTLEECKQDTLQYLYKNYVESDYFANVPMSKVLKASKSLPFKAIIIDPQGGGVLQFFLFYMNTKQIKECIEQNKNVDFVVCMPESDISPSYNVEKYQEIKKFGLRLLQKISPELKNTIQDCQIEYTQVSYYSPQSFKSDVKIKEE